MLFGYFRKASPQLRAGPPQRYAAKINEYLERGGKIELEKEQRGFVLNSENNEGDLARLWTFCLTFDQAEKDRLAGDVAEIGVFRGNTAFLLARFARRNSKTLYLLDTFEGFSQKDLTGIDSKQAVQFDDNSIDKVRSFIGEESVQFIKGYFPETASELPSSGRYCLVHIDCDLHAPIRSALEYFYPRMVPGGFLIVHDYASLWWPGAEKAVDDFFRDKPESVVLIPDISGSVVVRRMK